MTTTIRQSVISTAEAEGWQLEEVHGDTAVVLRKPYYGTVELHLLIFLLTFWTLGLGNIIYAYSRHWMLSPVWTIHVDSERKGDCTAQLPQLRELQTKIEAMQSDGWRLVRQIDDTQARMVERNYGNKRMHIVVFICTFWSWGLGNCAYAIYCNNFRRRKHTIRIDSNATEKKAEANSQ